MQAALKQPIEPYESIKQDRKKEQERQGQKNRYIRYTLFILTSCMMTVLICASYIGAKAEMKTLQRECRNLSSTLAGWKVENQNYQYYIDTKLTGECLTEIEDIAIQELGMQHPTKSQIIFYVADSTDYVRQYTDVPD